MLLDVLAAHIDELVELDPGVLSDTESIIALHRQVERLQAVVTRAAGRFEADGDWCLEGARTAASWMMAHCHTSKAAAKAETALARTLRHLPATQTAWLDGDISAVHARTLARARRPRTQDQMDADEDMLVGYAKSLPFHHFTKVVDYWTQNADDAGEDRKAEDQLEQRRGHMSQSMSGLWFLDAVFDPISGSVVAEEMDRLEKEMFDAEWAEAKLRLGHDPTTADLARTPAQRRADALVEMAIRSRTAPADGRRPEPLFTVLVDWETLMGRICELANGTVIAPGAIAPWLSTAWLERVVFHSRTRIEVGVAQRLFKGATRRAIEVRDRECFHPTCDTPAPRCQVDHIIPYAADGPTTQENGRLACPFHNRQRHRGPPTGADG
jgi:hypothetical protein